MQKNTIRDGSSTALHTAYSVYTVQTAWHISMYIYIVKEGFNSIGSGWWASEQNVGWHSGWMDGVDTLSTVMTTRAPVVLTKVITTKISQSYLNVSLKIIYFFRL